MHLKKPFFYLIILCTLLTGTGMAQDTATGREYTRTHHLHPGFTVTTGPYFIHIKTSTLVSDTSRFNHSKAQTEFGIGISLEYTLSQHFSLLFSPCIEIVNYDLNYLFAGRQWYEIGSDGGTGIMELPLDIEFFFKRHRKYKSYILAGAGIERIVKTDFNPDQGYMEMNRDNKSIEAGAGIEFYLHHFMIKVQGKYSEGFNNLIPQNITAFGQTVTGVYSSEAIFSISLMSY
jgi:hypothetical protein